MTLSKYDKLSNSAHRHAGSGRRALRLRAAAAALTVCAASAVLVAAELHEETVEAWDRYIAATAQRVSAELDDGERFLVLDFHEEAARLRREVLAGDVVVERMHALDERGDRFDVPKGAIHHWMGAILVPDAELSDVVDGLQHDIPTHELQENVLESRVLSRDGDKIGGAQRLACVSAPVLSSYPDVIT